MAKLVLFNKPFNVLSQFKADGERSTLAAFIKIPEVYPAGRLDYDSEGLMLLTDSGPLQHRIAHPDQKLPKTYWVQVEGVPDTQAIQQLIRGVTLKDGTTKPAKARLISEPENLWPRTPPIRERANIPTQWLELTISEGRNRQVRRMTAAVGHPTLRLVRAQIGDWKLGQLQPGGYALLEVESPEPTKKPFKRSGHEWRAPSARNPAVSRRGVAAGTKPSGRKSGRAQPSRRR